MDSLVSRWILQLKFEVGVSGRVFRSEDSKTKFFFYHVFFDGELELNYSHLANRSNLATAGWKFVAA